MSRNQTLHLLLLLLLITPLFAYNPKPLTSDGSGKTSHPVLFVHGRFSGSPKSFGVNTADEVGKAVSFENFNFRIVWSESNCPWDHTLIMKNYHIQVLCDITFADGRKATSANQGCNFQFATRAIEREDYETMHFQVDNITYDEDADVAIVNYTDISHPISPGKKYVTQIENEVQNCLIEKWSLIDLKRVAWDGKATGLFEDNYPAERDFVMHYQEGTTPDVLADELNLDTTYLHSSPKDGINSNGLYFFNSKEVEYDEIISNTCSNATVQFDYINFKDSAIGEKSWPDGINGDFTQPYYSRMKFGCTVTCHTSGEVVTASLVTMVDSVIKYDWENPKPNMTPVVESFSGNMLTYRVFDGVDSIRYTKDLTALFAEDVIANAEFNDTTYVQIAVKNEPLTNAYWEPEKIKDGVASYGHPNQLIDRMVEVMDDFYGKGNWESDPNKVIDIVANSMGGTTARLAIAHGASLSLDNPINHINRIIASSSPHEGSSFSTAINLLDSDNFSGLIELKEHIFNIAPSKELVGISHVLLPNEAGIFLGTELDIHLDLSLKGNYFGPYDVSGGIYWNHFSKKKKFVFDNTMVEDVNKSMIDIREKMIQFEQDAKNIALAAESPYTHELENLPYPTRLYDGSKIELTNFYIDGVPNFLSSIYTAILPKMERFVRKEFYASSELKQSEIDPEGATKAVMKALTAEFDELKTNLLDPLDDQWCSKSDMILDVFSQKGINAEQGFVENDPSVPFTVKEYTQKSGLAHVGMDLSNISGGEIKYTGGAKEGADIASVLLEYMVDPKNYPKPAAAPFTGYLGQSRGAVATDGVSYDVSLQLVQGVPSYYGGPLTIKYFVKGDPKKGPSLTVNNGAGMNIVLEQIGGELYAVTATSSFAEFNRGGVFPSSEMIDFSLSYSDGSQWNPANDWSCYGSEEVHENSHIVVWDSVGVKMSGLEPDYKNDTLITEISLVGSVKALSKERSGMNTVSQPSLSIQNLGDETLTGFHAYYYFTTGGTPLMKVFWMAEQSKAAWELLHIKDSIYAAHIIYDGVSVAPDGFFNYIEFEIHNEDWSIWNFEDDHSYMASSSLVENKKVVVTDLAGNALWGISPFTPDETGTTRGGQLTLLAADKSENSSEFMPRFRLLNSGSDTLENLRIYYYFTAEGANVPQLKLLNLPQCDVNVEHLGNSDYRLIYRCSREAVYPGIEYDAIYNTQLALHYGDGSSWDSSNDYSADELGSDFSSTSRVVIEDEKGALLYGVHPETVE